MSEPDECKLEYRLWPTNRLISSNRGNPAISAPQLFPSGRSAITVALRQLGLQRSDIVAVTPFSSHCVLSAVARVATPTVEVWQGAKALLAYEQWGWSFPAEALLDLERVAKSVAVVVDSVDTPYTKEGPASSRLTELSSFRVWSLGKTLGGLGGGLLSGPDGSLLKAPVGGLGIESMTGNLLRQVADAGVDPVNFFRENSRLPPDDLVEMVHSGSLESALKEEQAGRRKNAEVLLRKGFHSRWPGWMVDFLENGGAPGIVPLGFGSTYTQLQSISRRIGSIYGVETAVYHFNSAGNPISPIFVLCLALPIHSQVPDSVVEDSLDRIRELG